MPLSCYGTAFCHAQSEATAPLCGKKLSAASAAAHLTLQLNFCDTAKHRRQYPSRSAVVQLNLVCRICVQSMQ